MTSLCKDINAFMQACCLPANMFEQEETSLYAVFVQACRTTHRTNHHTDAGTGARLLARLQCTRQKIQTVQYPVKKRCSTVTYLTTREVT